MGALSFQYPLWTLPICLAIGVGYAALLYFRDQTFREQSKTLNWWLGVARALAVTIICLLLLGPLLKSLITEIKKPIIVLATDESESVANSTDTAALHKGMDALSAALDADFEVHRYAFGERLNDNPSWKFRDKVSNLSDVLSSAADLFDKQNLGAIIMATDGIYNEGSNPIYAAAKLTAPIFTVALGDTMPRRDLILKRVLHNNIAYLGDKFTLQADLVATNCAGAITNMTISKVEGANARVVQTLPVSIGSNDYFFTKEFILEATVPGVQRYRITLTTVSGEVSTVNNSKEIFIDVLDARQKVLLLANSPHPDLSALQQSISENKNYAVTVAYASDATVNVGNYDFVVLHGLPSPTNQADGMMSTLNTRRIPRLFIVSTQTDLRKINAVQSAVVINGGGNQSNDVTANVAPNFNLFTLDGSKLATDLPNFNPATAPFGDIKEGGGAQTLLYQRIGKIDTKYPLLTFQEQNGLRVGVLCMEGIWRWRLFDFMQHENHDQIDQLIQKMVQYLSVKEDKRKFRVTQEKNIYKENEAISFGAELYNDAYQLVNDPDASIAITSSEGKEYRYTFNKVGRSYALDAGILPTGNYSYKASTTYNGTAQTFSGQFSVQPIQLELYETTANHNILRQLSTQTGGTMVTAAQIGTLAELIKKQERIKPVMYTTNKTEPIINLKWVFGLLLLLLGMEWFARRYFGAY